MAYLRVLQRIGHGLDTMQAAWEAFARWFNGLRLDENTILVTFAVAVGILSALGVVAFFKLIDFAFELLYRWPVESYHWLSGQFYRPLVTAMGFAFAAAIARRLAGGEDGPNVPYVQLAVARRGGDVPTRPGLAHATASAVTLGCGGSAGSEGPVVVLGATVGSWLSRTFRFDPSRAKVLVAAGAGSGISAVFNAPLAGAFFALEEIVGSLSINAFPAVVVSSVVAALISRAVFGNHPSFPIPQEYGYSFLRELVLFFPLLGIVGGLVGAGFVRAMRTAGRIAHEVAVPKALHPWIGGAVVGAMVLLSGGVLVGYGHVALRPELFGRMGFLVLAGLALGKIVATAITLNSGGSGGLFTPSLYLGAAMGGAFGVAVGHIWPGLHLHPEVYALVGMGVMVAAATHAPITAILLVFEMTNDYAIVVPLMLSVTVAYIVARLVEKESVYSLWLTRRGETIERGTDATLLASIQVGSVFDAGGQVIDEAEPVHQLLERLAASDQVDFPVVRDDMEYVGMISLADLGRIAVDREYLEPIVLAADVASPSETVSPEDSLLEALRYFGVRGAATLPVVDRPSGRLEGTITRGHILAVYEKAVAGGSGPPAGEQSQGVAPARRHWHIFGG